MEQQTVQHSEEVKKLENELAGLQRDLEQKNGQIQTLEKQLEEAQLSRAESERKVEVLFLSLSAQGT